MTGSKTPSASGQAEICSKRRTAGGGRALAAGLAAVLAAFALAACGGGTDPDAGEDSAAAGGSPPATETEPTKQEVASFKFASQVESCALRSSDEFGSPIVIDNPQYYKLLVRDAVLNFHSARGAQDAWILPTPAAARRGEAELAPFRAASEKNHTEVIDTTLIAYTGDSSSGLTEQCITQAREQLTKQGESLADAGQPLKSDIPMLTKSQEKTALRARTIGEYCFDASIFPGEEDQGAGAGTGDSVNAQTGAKLVKSAGEAHEVLLQFLPLLKQSGTAIADARNGGITLHQIAEDLVAASGDAPDCLVAGDRQALKDAL